MIKNIITIILVIVLGYIMGIVVGWIFGILLGLGISLFFREIVISNYTVLVCYLIGISMGSVMGITATKLAGRITETDSNVILGSMIGGIIGYFAIFFYGVIYIPDPEVFEQAFYTFPITYSVAVGSDIGSIVFPVFGLVTTIQEIVRFRKLGERSGEDKNQLSFYKAKNNNRNN